MQFNRPIGKFQAIQNKLADMSATIEAARPLVYRAAWYKDTGRDYVQAAAMAKLFASEMCSRAANHAIQIFGGYGFMMEYPVQRYFRDAKFGTVVEGTSEIQRRIISKHLGL